jgi:hypothetical protein
MQRRKDKADATYKVQANKGADAGVARIDMKLEVVVLPVSDVDRAKWRSSPAQSCCNE